jgi:hypothetical protein
MDGKSVDRRPPPPLRTSATPPARSGVLESEAIAIHARLASFFPFSSEFAETWLIAQDDTLSLGG